jgi:hypothetical protein
MLGISTAGQDDPAHLRSLLHVILEGACCSTAATRLGLLGVLAVQVGLL